MLTNPLSAILARAIAIDHAGQLGIMYRGLAVLMGQCLPPKLLGGANDGCGYGANEAEGDLRYVEGSPSALLNANGAEEDVDEPAGAAQHHRRDEPDV